MGEPVRFYLDEHIPSAVAEGLRQRGIEVRTLVEMDRLGVHDKEHLAHARREGRVFVTHDDDVLRLAAEGVSHAGIVHVPRGGGRLETVCEGWSGSHGRRRKWTCASWLRLCKEIRRQGLKSFVDWVTAYDADRSVLEV